MQPKSPLFISSIELLAHSTELFRTDNDKKYKFIILHLANAVELILKDKLIASGITIYISNTNRTIGIWDCIKELGKMNILIPERAFLELLIDDRNSIQHRFGFPNKEAVYYYLSGIISFFKRFLKEEFEIELKEELTVYLDIPQLEFLGLEGSEILQLDKLKKFSIDLAIIQAFSFLQNEFDSLSRKGYKTSTSKFVTSRSQFFEQFLEILIDNNFVAEITKSDILNLREVRNQLVHAYFDTAAKDSTSKLNNAYKTALELVKGLEKSKSGGFFNTYDWDLLF